MPDELRPSDCHPDLEDHRLQTLAQFFADARLAVVALHDPVAGDDGWSMGCRSFARWRNGLLKKAQTAEWDWFRIVNPTKRFVFSVGQVPIRFYRGLSTQPPERTLANSTPELHQMAFAFEGVETPYRKLKWRFAIETGFLGEPTSIVFAGLAPGSGTVVCSWSIPFDVQQSIRDLEQQRSNDMVDLPAPRVDAPDRAYEASDKDAS